MYFHIGCDVEVACYCLKRHISWSFLAIDLACITRQDIDRSKNGVFIPLTVREKFNGIVNLVVKQPIGA